MTMRTYWCGDLRIKMIIEANEHYNYMCQIDVPEQPGLGHWTGTVTLAPYYTTVLAEDSDEAFRRIADSAVGFATYECEDLAQYARYYENGECRASRLKRNRWRNA